MVSRTTLIELKEVFNENQHKYEISHEIIKKVLTDLNMKMDEEIQINGSYLQWGWFCQFLLKEVIESSE